MRFGLLAVTIAALLAAWYAARLYSAGTPASPALLERDLTGQLWIVTGANTGVGFEVAKQLAIQHAIVVLACRDSSRAAAALARIQAEAGADARISYIHLDTASLRSVRAFGDTILARIASGELPVLRGVIANAGTWASSFAVTEDGFESTLATNYIGHFALVDQLTPALLAAPSARVVIVGSRAADFGTVNVTDLSFAQREWSAWESYAATKLANALHARELGRHFSGTRVVAVTAYPGFVATSLWRWAPLNRDGRLLDALWPLISLVMKSPREGAQTILCAALADDEAVPHGGYMAECARAQLTTPAATNDELSETLWHETHLLIAAALSDDRTTEGGEVEGGPDAEAASDDVESTSTHHGDRRVDSEDDEHVDADVDDDGSGEQVGVEGDAEQPSEL